MEIIKFKVDRTSDSSGKCKPCDNAILEEIKWVSDGQLRKSNEWILEINTLEELIDLQIKCGFEIIIGNDDKIYPTIEIYDDWRE